MFEKLQNTFNGIFGKVESGKCRVTMNGGMENESKRTIISDGVAEDRTNHYNQYQGIFRYGKLDIGSLKERIEANAGIIPYEIELTHCDEMDRLAAFKKKFGSVNTYDKPEIE